MACASGDSIGGSDLCVVCCHISLFGLVGISMAGESASPVLAMVVVGWRCLSANLADAVFAHYQTFHLKWRYIYIRYIRSYSGGNHANYDVAEMQKYIKICRFHFFFVPLYAKIIARAINKIINNKFNHLKHFV